MRIKLVITISAVLVTALFVAYTQLTIFVVQPIGALPDGITLVMSRTDKTQFIDSADAICDRLQSGVSLLCRGTILSAIVKNGYIYGRFPYSEFLYGISTNGQTYGR